MSEKKRITISVDPENLEYLDAECHNRSAFINELLEEYRTNDFDPEELVASFRLTQLRAEEESLENRLEGKREEIRRISSSVQTEEERRQSVVEDAVNELGINPGVGYDNAAAENWAEKANMDVEAFWEAYTEAYNDE